LEVNCAPQTEHMSRCAGEYKSCFLADYGS
jgi:hypothetical protein